MKARAIEELSCTLAGVLAAQFERHHDVLQRRQGWQQLETLKDEAHLVVAQPREPILILSGEIDSSQPD